MCAQTPPIAASKTRVAPGFTVAPAASTPPNGANSNSALVTWIALTTEGGSELPPGTSLAIANGVRAIEVGVGRLMARCTIGLLTSSARLSDTVDPAVMPIALAQ